MTVNLINTLAQPLKSTVQFIAHQERATGLSTSRFIQDTGTCLVPKATFARSKADLAENAFLELTQGSVIYFMPAIFGEKFARKIFSKKLDKLGEKSKEAKALVSTSAAELLKNKNALNSKVMPIKAAIALSSMIIPIGAFAINYFKNLFTLNVFKTGDFNNIANLEDKKEDKAIQDRVRRHAHVGIASSAAAYAGCVAGAVAMAKKGDKSKLLQNISELILAPGTKLFKNNPKKRDFVNKYFSLDFASDKGKLVLSKGQLTSCVLIGGAGYFTSSADRGKQNFLETLFRVPIVCFYVITGSELFERGMKKMLVKMGKCKEMINDKLETPKVKDLEKYAQELASKNGTNVKDEFKKLAKQKALISGVPYVFSIGVMGFFVAGISNLFTRYRYSKETRKNQPILMPQAPMPTVFKGFQTGK